MKKIILYLSLLLIVFSMSGCETMDEKEMKAEQLKQESQAVLEAYMKTQATNTETTEQGTQKEAENQQSSTSTETASATAPKETTATKNTKSESTEAPKNQPSKNNAQNKSPETAKTTPAPKKETKTQPSSTGAETKAATAASTAKETTSKPQSTETAQSTPPKNEQPAQNNNPETAKNTQAPPKSEYNTTPPAGVKYIGNSNSKKRRFHKSTCSSVRDMNPEHIVEFNSREAAINAGYQPCQRCNP